MRHLLICVLLLVGASVRPSLAQQPAPPAATGQIGGVLTSADLGRPVRKAQVRLVSTTPKMTRTTTSDADGRYVFADLPAADYTLSVSKAGYLDSVFGARRPGASVPGTPIELAAGQKLENISLKVPRGGVISGVITDEFGDPAFGVPVRAIRVGFQNGERMAQPTGNAVTDDLGAYRIAGLLPGDYVVSAVPRDTVAAAAATAESIRLRQSQILASGSAEARARITDPRNSGGGGSEVPSPAGYVPVYFGGTASPSAAGMIKLGLSQHAGGIDLQLQTLKTGTVSGVVTNPDGTPTMASVQLVDPLTPIANLSVWFRHAGADGRFSFAGVTPGSYVLRAQATKEVGSAGGGELTAAMPVLVAEGGIVDGAITLRRGVSVSGSVDISALPAGVDLSRVQVSLIPITTASDWEAPVPQASPDAEGKFAMSPVAPGPYRVMLRGLPQGWTLASAVFGGIDAADVNLEVKPGENVTDGVVKITPRTSDMSGAVTNASNDPVSDLSVLLFPADRDLWTAQSRRIRVVQTGPDGRYAIRALPAGDYRVAAVIAPEPGQEFDQSFLAQLVGASTAVTLVEGQTGTQNLRVK